LRPDEEGVLAARVAALVGARHQIVDDVAMPLSHLDDPAYATDEPSDAIDADGWRRLAPRVAAASPVLFIGEDGDALLRPPSPRRMLGTWSVTDVLWRTFRYAVEARRYPHLGLYLRNRLTGRSTPREELPPWIRADVRARTGPQHDAPLAPHPTRPETHAMLSGSVWQSLHESSDARLCGAPLESRWPLLDTRLLEFALAIPPIPWCQRKALFRRSFHAELPREILDRPKTPLPDYYEKQIVRWRTANREVPPALLMRVREFVDTSGIESILRGGSTTQVLAGWRVLQLEQWLGSRYSSQRSDL
jgi:asparagine synthase (glutamine-hydrolysing)